MSDLFDTEAGLRSAFELILEGVSPTQAQIAERAVQMRKKIRIEKAAQRRVAR